MEVKIKQGEEMLDATIEMVNGVMIVSPKVEKFEPKDGDILSYMNGDKPTIYVYREGGDDITSYYVAYSSSKDKVFISTKTDVLYRYMDNVRCATEGEKKLLFDKLAEECYEFDFDKKELVKFKWKPKVGDTYFRPDFNRCMFMCYEGECRYDTMRYIKDCIEKGWCFKTKEECQEFCNRLNDAINSVKP